MNKAQNEFVKLLKRFARMAKISYKNKVELFRLLAADIADPEKLIDLQKKIKNLAKKPTVKKIIMTMIDENM